ncbi:39S ribosomal protein L43 [Mactra antiquata]
MLNVNMGSNVIPSTFLRNVMKNGIGRHVCQLQRVTLSLCKWSPGSAPAREFVEQDMVDFTRQNPGIVFYLKPRRHRSPVLKAEYLNGYTEEIDLTKLSREEINHWLGLLKGRSGQQIVRLRKDFHTDTPSIQGVWNPFLFKDTELSIKDVRDPSLSEYISPFKSATEKLLELKKKSGAS